jgi:fructokinase
VIVVAGESLIDLIVRPDGRVEAAPGGGPYNVARALGRLGRRVAFLGRVSTDRFGAILRAGLEADGVDLALVVATDDPTLLATAELGADGSAAYRFYAEGTAAPGLTIDDVPNGLPAWTSTLHVGTLGLVYEPIASTIEAIVDGVGPGVLVVVDPNCRPAAIRDVAGYRARLGRILARADVVKASVDDLAWLDPASEPVAAARRLIECGPAVVLVTDGARPVRIVTRDRVVELPVPAVEIPHSVGAGDAFGAGFVAGWVSSGRGRADLGDLDAVRSATMFAIEIGSRTAGRA